MPLQDRARPLGELVADPTRGLVYTNRGCLDDDTGRIRRRSFFWTTPAMAARALLWGKEDQGKEKLEGFQEEMLTRPQDATLHKQLRYRAREKHQAVAAHRRTHEEQSGGSSGVRGPRRRARRRLRGCRGPHHGADRCWHSTESGIPDYRGPNGVWTRNPAAMRLVSIDAYLADPEVRRDAWQEREHHPAWTARPSTGHRALVEIEHDGNLQALITHNIDGLHQAAGSSPELVLELHGTIHEARCLECGHRTPMKEQLDRVRAGEADPSCTECGGIQRSATIAFGQKLDHVVLEAALSASRRCDLFLAIGPSLTVQPAASLCGYAQRAGARLVVVHAEPTPLDDRADAVLRGSIGKVLPRLVGRDPG